MDLLNGTMMIKKELKEENLEEETSECLNMYWPPPPKWQWDTKFWSTLIFKCYVLK